MNIVWLILAGAAGGIIAGMGMGGGTLTIPILTLALDVEQKTAQSVNLIAFVVMSAPVLAIHVKNRLVDFSSLMKTAPLAIIVSAVRAWFVPAFSAEILLRCFGGSCSAFGTWQALREVIDKVKEKKGFSPKMFPPSLVGCSLLTVSDTAYYPEKLKKKKPA